MTHVSKTVYKQYIHFWKTWDFYTCIFLGIIQRNLIEKGNDKVRGGGYKPEIPD